MTGKICITHVLHYDDIWIDEYLSLPGVGIMFMTEDEETKYPVMNTLFSSGVLIQETEGITPPDQFHEMVIQQREFLKNCADTQVAKEDALKHLKETQTSLLNDPSTA